MVRAELKKEVAHWKGLIDDRWVEARLPFYVVACIKVPRWYPY